MALHVLGLHGSSPRPNHVQLTLQTSLSDIQHHVDSPTPDRHMGSFLSERQFISNSHHLSIQPPVLSRSNPTVSILYVYCAQHCFHTVHTYYQEYNTIIKERGECRTPYMALYMYAIPGKSSLLFVLVLKPQACAVCACMMATSATRTPVRRVLSPFNALHD